VPEEIRIGGGKIILKKEESITILEDITRNSIKVFLSLIGEYDSKEDIQREIDQSIHDPMLRSKYLRLMRKSDYVNLDFLDKFA
jgi:DNA primase large subunit